MTQRFTADDGTALAYHLVGEGPALVCLPGGPMQASGYLGDLGGLSEHRQLVRLDLRGTGDSAEPADAASYRCDRQVPDVEALRRDLGLDRIDLLGHSAGGSLAVLYAARHPDRVGRLVLVCPSPRVVDLEVSDADRRQVALLRSDEPWFPDAFAAFERIWAGQPTPADWDAMEPFTQGSWDDDTRARVARADAESNDEAAGAYYADGALDPAATRATIAALPVPVLLVAGEYDVALPPDCMARYASLFAAGHAMVVPRAGHEPWHDDAELFAGAVSAFLS